jgi:predicted PurR-regulated permease PerM
VPSPVTLGALTGIMALIPGGAPLSFTLVSIYLAASGRRWPAGAVHLGRRRVVRRRQDIASEAGRRLTAVFLADFSA